MKVNELPKGTPLRGTKVKLPDGSEGYWYSQWQKGVWVKHDMNDTQVHPVFVENLEEALEWEVVQD